MYAVQYLFELIYNKDNLSWIINMLIIEEI
jgi:hypothetical protein